MQTTHFPLILAHHTLHYVTFEPDTFHEHDLLWLPHHAQLARAGRKRKAEHLAGRIAAVHALREWGHKNVPGIGEQRQPLWPHGLFGSISHGATTALAVVSRQPVGVDIETIFTPQTAVELASSIVTETEKFDWQEADCALNKRSHWHFPPKRAPLRQPRNARRQAADSCTITFSTFNMTR